MKFAIKAVALLLVSKEGFKHEDAVKLAYNEVRNVEQNMGPRVQKANVLVLKEYGLAGIALLAITVKAIEDKYDIDLGNKGSIFSTPIHKDEGQKLETPAHEEGAKIESFPGEENTLNQQPGLEHPGTGFKLPGFDAKEVDDLNILFKDNDEAFVKLFGKKMADNLIKKVNDDNYLKQYEGYKKQDGSGRYECEKQQSPLWKELENFKDEFRTNGLKGNNKQYYRWDYRHKDIEVYDSNARHLASVDPVTGKKYRVGNMKENPKLKNIIK